MPANTEAAAVKAARRTQERANTPVPATQAPPVIGQGEPSRHEILLLHPEEPRIVAEATGSLYGTEAGQEIPGFTIAPEDAFETFIPHGCTTAVTRLRWTRGQHVPNEVYAAHVAGQKAPAGKADGAAS